MLAPRPIAVTYFGSKSTHQPLKCAQFRLGAIVARQVMGHGQKVWFDIFLIRLRGGEICPYNCISFILKSDFFDLITSVQALRRSRPHSHCGSIRFRTFLLLYSWRGHDFTKIQPQPGCLITKPIADVFNNHKTNIFFLLKLAYFSTLPIFFWIIILCFSTVLMFKRHHQKKTEKQKIPIGLFWPLGHASKSYMLNLKNNANCHVHRLFVLILSLIFNFTKHNFFHASNNLTPKFRDFYCNNQDKTVHCERVGLCE